MKKGIAFLLCLSMLLLSMPAFAARLGADTVFLPGIRLGMKKDEVLAQFEDRFGVALQEYSSADENDEVFTILDIFGSTAAISLLYRDNRLAACQAVYIGVDQSNLFDSSTEAVDAYVRIVKTIEEEYKKKSDGYAMILDDAKATSNDDTSMQLFSYADYLEYDFPFVGKEIDKASLVQMFEQHADAGAVLQCGDILIKIGSTPDHKPDGDTVYWITALITSWDLIAESFFSKQKALTKRFSGKDGVLSDHLQSVAREPTEPILFMDVPFGITKEECMQRMENDHGVALDTSPAYPDGLPLPPDAKEQEYLYTTPGALTYLDAPAIATFAFERDTLVDVTIAFEDILTKGLRRDAVDQYFQSASYFSKAHGYPSDGRLLIEIPTIGEYASYTYPTNGRDADEKTIRKIMKAENNISLSTTYGNVALYAELRKDDAETGNGESGNMGIRFHNKMLEPKARPFHGRKGDYYDETQWFMQGKTIDLDMDAIVLHDGLYTLFGIPFDIGLEELYDAVYAKSGIELIDTIRPGDSFGQLTAFALKGNYGRDIALLGEPVDIRYKYIREVGEPWRIGSLSLRLTGHFLPVELSSAEKTQSRTEEGLGRFILLREALLAYGAPCTDGGIITGQRIDFHALHEEDADIFDYPQEGFTEQAAKALLHAAPGPVAIYESFGNISLVLEKHLSLANDAGEREVYYTVELILHSENNPYDVDGIPFVGADGTYTIAQ